MKLQNITFDEIYKHHKDGLFGKGFERDGERYYFGKIGDIGYGIYPKSATIDKNEKIEWDDNFSNWIKNGEWVPLTEGEKQKLKEKFKTTIDKPRNDVDFSVRIIKRFPNAKKSKWIVETIVVDGNDTLTSRQTFETRKEARATAKSIRENYSDYGLFILEIIGGKWKAKLEEDSEKKRY